jgi:hypothetical protein
MSANLFFMPFATAVDENGAPLNGAKLYFYAANTLTPADTYADAEFDTEHSNPVEADAAGRFPAIYLQNISYKVILKTSADVTIEEVDDVNALPATFGADGETKGGDYTIVVADRGKFFEVTATATITLPTLADAGEGFPVAVLNNGTGTVTIDPGASTINGLDSLVLYPTGWAILTSGAEWKAIFNEGTGNVAYKTATTSRASTTAYAADPDLALDLLAGATYLIDFHLSFIAESGGAGAGIKVRFGYDADADSLGGGYMQMFLSGNGFEPKKLVAATLPYEFILEAALDDSANSDMAQGSVLIIATTSGTFTIDWAQVSSVAADTRVLAGSFIRATRIS